MSLYKEFFYKVSYGLDSVTDAQPNYLQVEIYANPDICLNEYCVKDESDDSSKQHLILHLKSYIALEKKIKQHWTINTVLLESTSEFFNAKKNEKDYGYIFAKKHIKSHVKDINEILNIVLKEYSNNKPNTQQMAGYLARNYHAQKGGIEQYLKNSSASLEKTLIDKELKFIKTYGAVGIDVPIDYKKETYFSVPFYLAIPQYLSKLQLNKSLNFQLKEKQVKSLKIKI